MQGVKIMLGVAVQAYFWRANVKHFFAKCVVAILDSQSRGRLGRDRNFYQGGGRKATITYIKHDGSANYR